MTGKDIAANLQRSKLVWNTGDLATPVTPPSGEEQPRVKKYKYCILGIKAQEMGVSPLFMYTQAKYISELYNHNDWSQEENKLLHKVYSINDKFRTKTDVIAEFLLQPDLDYPIEKFVLFLKTKEKEWLKKRRAAKKLAKQAK